MDALTHEPQLDDAMLEVWHRQLLELNLERFEPDSEHAAFFRNSPQFLTTLYPDVRMVHFLPENYGAYMLHQPKGWLQKRWWRRNLRLFAYCTEWISLGLPYQPGFSKMSDADETRLRKILRATGPSPKATYHAAARIRINLLALFHYCERAVDGRAELRPRDAQHIEAQVIDFYNRWLPLYKQMLAGNMLAMPYKELDKLSQDLVKFQKMITAR